MSTTLQDLVNRAVFYSTEMQTHFGGLIADAEWEVDFTADPHLTFTSDDGVVLRARPHLLGSESTSQSTWLWGWENINEFPEPVVGLSHDVRKFGAGEEVEELTTAELALDDELALRLTLAAKEATGKWTHYPAAAGAGTTVWLLIDAPELVLPRPQVKVSVRALMQGLTQTTVSDHRAAVESYATKREIPVRELPDGGLRLLFADGSADLSFDEERRISNCDMNTPLEGEAADQFAQATTGTPAEVGPGSGAARETPAPAVPASPVGQTPSRSDEPAQAAAKPAAATTPEPATGSEAGMTSGDSADRDRTASPAPSPAAEAADAGPAGSTPPSEAPAESQDPVREVSRDAADVVPPEGDDRDQAVESGEETPTDQQPKKKKGLFSKLFGR